MNAIDEYFAQVQASGAAPYGLIFGLLLLAGVFLLVRAVPDSRWLRLRVRYLCEDTWALVCRLAGILGVWASDRLASLAQWHPMSEPMVTASGYRAVPRRPIQQSAPVDLSDPAIGLLIDQILADRIPSLVPDRPENPPDDTDRSPVGLSGVITMLPDDPWAYPIGWHMLDGRWVLQAATMQPGTDRSAVNVLITGQIGSGKDWVVRGIVHALMDRLTPTDLSLVLIDGKGLDYPVYDDCPFVLRTAHVIEHVAPCLTWLDHVVRDRRDRLAAAGAKNWWEYYRAGGRDMPFLLVYVSELTRLERFVDKFWTWLEDHLTTDRAYGVGFILGTQTAANMPTRWRNQCQVFIAGYQPSKHADAPNTNIPTEDWNRGGCLPPSQLPLAPGHMAVAHGRALTNVRGVAVTDQEEAQRLTDLKAQWGGSEPDEPDSPDSPDDDPATPTIEDISAWVGQQRQAGEPVTQNAACQYFWGGKNAERNRMIREAFAQLGITE